MIAIQTTVPIPPQIIVAMNVLHWFDQRRRPALVNNVMFQAEELTDDEEVLLSSLAREINRYVQGETFLSEPRPGGDA